VTIEVFMSSRLLIDTKTAVTMSSFFNVRLKEEKKNRKSNFVVLFFSNMLLLTEKKKNRESNFVVLSFSKMLFSIEKKKSKSNSRWSFFRSNSSSFSLMSSFIVSEFSFASQSISSWFSSTLRDMIIMFEAFLKNEDCFITHFDENLLTDLIHNASSSFVLSFDLFFFVFIVFASSFNALCFRKRAHESFSSTFKKRVRLTNNHYDCTLSSKWLEDLKKARCIESVKRIEHLLRRLYYLNRQICKKHINQLRQLFELLSIEDLVEMKEVL
jgi:hypothetical protein